MARKLFGAELGFRLHAENDTGTFVDILQGAGAPPGSSGVSDEATIGSIWLDRSNGDLYKKIANTSSASDWEAVGTTSIDELSWRNEKVVAATNDTVSAGSVDVTAFSDNEKGLDGNDFSVGDYLLGDVDGTPALFEVTAVTSATDITVAAASQAIANNDTFIVQNYLPDSPASQEDQAIVHFPDASGSAVKIGDVNWNFADGINLAAGYAAASGDVTSADSIQSAIEKLDGNNDAQSSVLGTAQGDTDLGTFPGSIIADNDDVKGALTSLEDAAEGFAKTQTGVSSATVLDSVLVDDYRSVAWLVTAFDEANPSRIKSAIVHGANDGTASADATLADDNISSLLQNSPSFNTQISVVLSGTGAAQVMQLQVDTGEPGVTYTAVRLGSAPSGY